SRELARRFARNRPSIWPASARWGNGQERLGRPPPSSRRRIIQHARRPRAFFPTVALMPQNPSGDLLQFPKTAQHKGGAMKRFLATAAVLMALGAAGSAQGAQLVLPTIGPPLLLASPPLLKRAHASVM